MSCCVAVTTFSGSLHDGDRNPDSGGQHTLTDLRRLEKSAVAIEFVNMDLLCFGQNVHADLQCRQG